MYRIGVDVGGTNTDAALLNVDTELSSPSRGVVLSCKSPTTTDVATGIQTAVERVISESGVPRSDILSIAIGTTHFVNAVVQADSQKLSKVAVVRLCGPYTKSIPPFTDFPANIGRIVAGPTFYLDGGLEIDGREIGNLNEAEVLDTVAKIRSEGIRMVAVIGVFSSLDHQGGHEDTCKRIMLEAEPGLSVVCSHDIGGPGFLARENATILNAAILPLAKKTIKSFEAAMHQLKLSCPLYLTQNDGTLCDAATASEVPIRSFASGATNSMMGAAFLAGMDRNDGRENQVIVVDIGGTTTDVGALLPSGFPRQAKNYVELGGVRTTFSMPEVVSIGLGGGSRVRQEARTVTVGPDSVGHRLTSEAIAFGGESLTATDIAVVSGIAGIGDKSRVEHIDPEVVKLARNQIKKTLEKIIDSMRISNDPVILLLVGGGSVIQLDELKGVIECRRPPHHDSANAVGAAIAKIAGTVDVIEILDNKDREAVIRTVKERAIEDAVERGAERDNTRVVEFDVYPLQYVSNQATRIIAKAVGRSGQHFAGARNKSMQNGESDAREPLTQAQNSVMTNGVEDSKSRFLSKPSLLIDIASYRPEVRNHVWYISAIDLEFMELGTGVLGTGGGGPSYDRYLIALMSLANGGAGKMRVVSPDYLADDDICAFGSYYGAPSVSGERLTAGNEVFAATDAVVRVTGVKKFHAIMADEIGGGNGLATFPSSVHYDVPIVDGDTMGRAYPTLEHRTPYVYGESITPCAMADGKGNVGLGMSAESNNKLEKIMRTMCVELGSSTSIVTSPLSGKAIKKYAIPYTVSQAWYIGRAILLARRAKVDLMKAIFHECPGKLLFVGKIISVTRGWSKGYTMGRCVIAPLSKDELEDMSEVPQETRNLVIPFQNEYLCAGLIDPEDQSTEPEEETICTVPDLISILGMGGEAIGSQDLRFGLKVKVIGMPAHPLWTDDVRALSVGGPEYFGLDMEYKRIGAYSKPKSVIEEFNQDV